MKKKVQNKIDAIVNEVKLDLIYSVPGNQPASVFMRGLRRVQRRAVSENNKQLFQRSGVMSNVLPISDAPVVSLRGEHAGVRAQIKETLGVLAVGQHFDLEAVHQQRIRDAIKVAKKKGSGASYSVTLTPDKKMVSCKRVG